jgi:3-deoxy-D-arabino-heptulosonate 7-phosphate (DAHP) synthase
VIVDPSHAGGLWWLVDPMAKAAMVVGADGVMVEVHNDPPMPSVTASNRSNRRDSKP